MKKKLLVRYSVEFDTTIEYDEEDGRVECVWIELGHLPLCIKADAV